MLGFVVTGIVVYLVYTNSETVRNMVNTFRKSL